MISTEMAKRIVLDDLYCSMGFAGARRHEEPVEVFDGMTVADCLRLYGDTVVDYNDANAVVLTYNSHYNTAQVHLTLAPL